MKKLRHYLPIFIFFVLLVVFFSVSCDYSKKNIALPHEMIQSLQEKNGVFELENSETSEDVSLSLGMGGRTDYYYESPYQESLGHTENYATTNCLNNLHCINEAMQRYTEDHEGRLPPVFTTDENGKPLHSWRVLILPYFDNDKYLKCLYDQIRLDEPWNSEWNSQFHALIPRIYRCFSPLRKDKTRNAGETPYSVIIGEKTAFPIPKQSGKNIGALFEDVRYGSILVIERRETVCWMQPDKELTLEEIENGSFLQEAANAPSHVDRNQKLYICASLNHGFDRALFNEKTAVEQIAKRAQNDTINIKDANRIVIVDGLFRNFEKLNDPLTLSWLDKHEVPIGRTVSPEEVNKTVEEMIKNAKRPKGP